MYINPFWCGVIATILTELIGIIGYSIYLNVKEKNKIEIDTLDNVLKDTLEHSINK